MKLKLWLASSLVLLLVMLTGCQAVGGFDVNQGLLGTLKVKPQQSSSTISLHVEPTGNASAEEREIIDAINSVSVSVYDAKVQSEDVVSAKGAVHYRGISLPVTMSLDRAGMMFTLEGAKKPFYIDLNQEEALAGFDQSAYRDKIRELVLKAFGLFIKHAPNPHNISVANVTENVYGEKVALTKLSVQLTGTELVQLVKPMLASLAQDEEGLKGLIGQGLDLATDIATSMGGEASLKEELAVFGKNREEVLNTLYTKVKEGLNKVVSQYDANVDMMYTQVPELQTVLGSNTVLKTDLYFDGHKDLRKDRTELTVALPATEKLPVTSFTIRSESEIWNVNGAVMADKPDTSGGVVNVEGLTPGGIVRNFDSGSQVYYFLKNVLHVTHKDMTIDPKDSYYLLVTKKGTTMIALHDLTDELDAKLEWDATAKQVTVTDDITGAKFVIKPGMKQIKVDDRTIGLPQPVFIDKDGTLYVPLRQAAAALGAKVTVQDGKLLISRD